MKYACLFACLLLQMPVDSCPADEGPISFNRDIRPLLSDRCYYCHGFDENHREADLRLDLRDDAEGVISPHDPDASELIRRITSEDEDELMPPPDAHKQAFDDDEVALIRRWIDQGAPYEPHWALVPPKKSDAAEELVAGAIDHYVAGQHAKRGFDFAQPALPTKWLRRVSLDLTGLPPTLAQLDAFAKAIEESTEVQEIERVYEEAVDRLLASPHFGERMALDWLDVARYADTNGFQSDAYRMNWPWRDWVIKAFNQNMPFDQFAIEQLAGDLLENPTEDQLIATAFNRNHMINGEGGAIPEENLVKNQFDRVETTGTTWLGLTVGCCQCHDHKFDPLKQSDYYSLLSFFNQISETGGASKKFTAKHDDKPFAENFWVDKPYVSIATDEQKERLASLQEATRDANQRIREQRDQYLPDFVKWVSAAGKRPNRLDFARWLVSPQHPLTSRVTVN